MWHTAQELKRLNKDQLYTLIHNVDNWPTLIAFPQFIEWWVEKGCPAWRLSLLFKFGINCEWDTETEKIMFHVEQKQKSL